jgi:hypothetical protein
MTKIIEINSDIRSKSAIPEGMVRQMYDLLGSNMVPIIGGTGPEWRSDAEFYKWRDGVFLGEVQKDTRHILLLDETGLRGFLSYTAASDGVDIYLNEVQIRESCRADGATLRRLLRTFADRVRELPHEFIGTYSNKANSRVHTLATKCGFEKVDEAERGVRYRMPGTTFLTKYSGARDEEFS